MVDGEFPVLSAELPDQTPHPRLATVPDLDQQSVALGLHALQQGPPEVDAGRHLGLDLDGSGPLRLDQCHEHVRTAGLDPERVGLEASRPQLVAGVCEVVGQLLDAVLQVEGSAMVVR